MKGSYIMTSKCIGKIYSSKECGKFKILDELEIIGGKKEDKSNQKRYYVEFLDTGYKTSATIGAITHGRVKDRLLPSVAGIGYIGANIHITHEPYFRIYKSWNDMMNRCYNKNDYDYPFYGALGISVATEWHNFFTYYCDVVNLPGYENKLLYPDIYQLDKDYLQLNLPKSQRVYSKYTCIWISKYDNTLIMNVEQETISGYHGIVYKDNAYHTRIKNIQYGKFNCPEAAANLYNYLYPIFMEKHNNIFIPNNVPYIPIEELSKYTIK